MACKPVVESASLEWTSYIRGHHTYCQEWTLVVGEVPTLKQQFENCYDKFTVAVVKNERPVGHVANTVNKAVSCSLRRAGHGGFCEVRENRVNHRVNLGVEVPCTVRIGFTPVRLT